MAMEELARPAIEAVTSGRVRFHPENYTSGVPRLDGEHPAVVHLPPAVVGPPAAGLVPRPGDLRRAPSRRAARAGAATPTCSTPGSPARCGRSRPSAGPTRRRSSRPSIPPTRWSPRRDIIFLWVARMIMMGLEFTGEIPFSDVHVHSIIQAPDGRRMSKSLGTGIDPLDLIEGGPRPPVFAQGRQAAGEFPGLRRRRPALGAAGDVLRPGRPLRRGQGRPGPAADQQAVERRPPDPARAWRRAARAPPSRRAPSRTAGSCRAWSAPGPRSRQRIERYDFSHAALAVYDFVYRELCDWYLELVKPRLRAGEPELARHAAARADRDGRARPPADPVRDRGDLRAHPGRRGPAGRPRVSPPAAETRSTPRPRRRSQRGSRPCRRCARWRDADRGRGAARPSRPGWPADGYEETAEHLARLARIDARRRATGGTPWRRCRSPAARWRSSPPTSSTSRPPSAASSRAPRQARVGDRPCRAKLANQGFVAKAPGGGGGGAREAGAAASGAGGAVRRDR